MILSALPDPEVSPGTKQPSVTENTVLYGYTNGKYQYPAHATPYLFAINFRNKGQYRVNDQPVQLSERCFYFLNPGDSLAINFKDKLPLNTLFILFNEDFVNDAVGAIAATCDELLENPSIPQTNKFAIPAVPFESAPVLAKLWRILATENITRQQLDDYLFDLIAGLVSINNNLSHRLNKIDVVKTTTRNELYKRLFTAREFIEDNALQSGLTIDAIAAEACMNKFHLLANFKAFYGATPHQYLINLKLQKAFQLLKLKDSSVAETCYAVGFESPSSFSGLFKKKFSVSPSALLSE